MIQSLWKFTFDPSGTPLVLLNYGDMLEGEVRFPLKRGVEVVQITAGAAPFIRPSGNSSVTISFEVFPTGATDAAARTAVLDSILAINATGKKPLKIEAQGVTSKYWQFANCYIPEHDPARVIESARPRYSKVYTLICTGLSAITP